MKIRIYVNSKCQNAKSCNYTHIYFQLILSMVCFIFKLLFYSAKAKKSRESSSIWTVVMVT